jgi:hypothetical protein
MPGAHHAAFRLAPPALRGGRGRGDDRCPTSVGGPRISDDGHADTDADR